GYFFFNEDEYKKSNTMIRPFYKKVLGAREFFHSITRYCLWLNDENLKVAMKHEFIKNIIEDVKHYRLGSKREATRKLAGVPHRFGEVRYEFSKSIIIPGLSAEKREYIPIGFLSEDTVVTNLAQVVYNAEPWLFGLIHSKINNLWVHMTSGYFKKDIRYSPVLSYNTFPFPPITEKQKEEITKCVFRILEEREQHPDKTLAQLYDPNKMPDGLREAHRQNDLAVERCYRSKPFTSDEERLEYLFKLYEKMIAEEKEQGGLFEQQKKTKKGKKK
nr:class I SAM-dependent DNA methyltransferase [Candidatus Kapabacteria bacterium]